MADRVRVLGPGDVSPGLEHLRPAYDVKATTAETGGIGTIFTVVIRQAPPLHLHQTADEAFFVLEGVVELYVDGSVYRCEPGSFGFLPKGVPHAPRAAAGSEPPVVLVLDTSGGFEQFAERVTQLGSSIQAAGAAGVAGTAYEEAFADYGWRIIDADFWEKYDAGTWPVTDHR